tara:strand:+ start:196057 stop:196548 length:492 start_codon:yes stop_codon:yes gene_type:complete
MAAELPRSWITTEDELLNRNSVLRQMEAEAKRNRYLTESENFTQQHGHHVISGDQKPLEVIKIQNNDGDTVLLTPIEGREAVRRFIQEELDKQSITIGWDIRKSIESKVYDLFGGFQKEMSKFMDNKINQAAEKICEDILSSTIKQKIEAKVEERLKEIKDKL